MYKFEFTKHAFKELSKLEKKNQKIIYSWIEKYLMNCDDPRIYGKALVGDKAGMWRYRVGTYRIICDIKDHEFLIVAIRIGHRKNVYK